ncbi:hypothetical protein QOT17_004498 [Balamuthia mandrillaris]
MGRDGNNSRRSFATALPEESTRKAAEGIYLHRKALEIEARARREGRVITGTSLRARLGTISASTPKLKDEAKAAAKLEQMERGDETEKMSDKKEENEKAADTKKDKNKKTKEHHKRITKESGSKSAGASPEPKSKRASTLSLRKGSLRRVKKGDAGGSKKRRPMVPLWNNDKAILTNGEKEEDEECDEDELPPGVGLTEIPAEYQDYVWGVDMPSEHKIETELGIVRKSSSSMVSITQPQRQPLSPTEAKPSTASGSETESMPAVAEAEPTKKSFKDNAVQRKKSKQKRWSWSEIEQKRRKELGLPPELEEFAYGTSTTSAGGTPTYSGGFTSFKRMRVQINPPKEDLEMKAAVEWEELSYVWGADMPHELKIEFELGMRPGQKWQPSTAPKGKRSSTFLSTEQSARSRSSTANACRV